MDHSELSKRFTYHPPTTEGKVEAYQRIREDARLMANTINTQAPESREKSLAITKLEETVMWANAAIARNE
jgi:hypothetical protein